jgi:hypothetical protein
MWNSWTITEGNKDVQEWNAADSSGRGASRRFPEAARHECQRVGEGTQRTDTKDQRAGAHDAAAPRALRALRGRFARLGGA